jgi:3-phenylpropionate/trans-cinnamate dioxygenase ferredoxin reductase subunit
MTQSQRLVVVGAGHAGGAAVAFLRQYGHIGPITLIGEEPFVPYQRPPLSKAWLKGEADADALALKPLSFYADQGVDFRADTRVERLSVEDRTIDLGAGQTLGFDALILATGARARPLAVEGAGLDGVQQLRTAADAEALKARLGPGRRLVVIGGGYVGLEVAASARALGARVTVIEREARLLARVACEPLARFFHDQHLAHGVEFVLGASAAAFEARGGALGAVILSTGAIVPCDVAVVGIGAAPNQDLAVAAGIACNDGILVDEDAATSAREVYAIGDVTRRPLPLYDRMARLESVPSALEQAKQAASKLTGRPRPKPETPWQWSDQYDLKLQIAGYPFAADQIVVRGAPDAAGFAVYHLKGDQVQAVEAVNAPPAFMMGKQWIGSRQRVDIDRLADPMADLRSVARLETAA